MQTSVPFSRGTDTIDPPNMASLYRSMFERSKQSQNETVKAYALLYFGNGCIVALDGQNRHTYGIPMMSTSSPPRQNDAWRLGSYCRAALFALLVTSMCMTHENALAQTTILESRPAKGPADSSYGTTDPVTSGLQATEDVRNRWLEQQHRFQANSNRRELRPKRPEPGEMEVTREDNLTTPSDPLRNTLRSILPKDR